MSGFAPDWLRLREPADHRARDRGLLMRLASHFNGRDEVAVFDLGSGLGSNLRAACAALPARQHWVLVDHDAALLAAACLEIAAWADSARATTSGVEAVKDGRSLHVEVKHHDLTADPAPWGDAPPDLVTAAALFDLVSEEWIGRICGALARARLPLYAALTHDGATEWTPTHPADAAMGAAFERHFGGDKGFGPAAGGAAARIVGERLARSGYAVLHAPSPWRLGSGDRALIAALAEGWAGAVRETGAVPERTIEEWLAARTAAGAACTIGHQDLLALPAR